MNPRTRLVDDAIRENVQPDETLRKSSSVRVRRARVDLQAGVVCLSCWQVHPPGDVGSCTVCGATRPARGWSRMPFRLRNRYEFRRLLGRGAMGAVFLAVDLMGVRDDDGQLPAIAVKVIQDKAAEQRERMRQMFEHEISVAPLLGRSPYFVRTFGYEVGAAPFLIMELVHWPTLKKLLKAGSLSPDRTARLGLALLEAIEVMHYFRVVHRDLKPSNIFVQERGDSFQVKIADLGVWCRDHDAALPESLQEKRSFTGTLGYMSPEQMDCEQVGRRSDLHALGSILWRCATGTIPYPIDGEGLREQLAARIEAVQAAPAPHAALPEGLYDILRTALAFDPDERFLDAREMSIALREFLRDWAHVRSERLVDIEQQIAAVTERIEELRGAPHADRFSDQLDQLGAAIGSFHRYADDGGAIDIRVFNDAMASVRLQLSEVAEAVTDPYDRERGSGSRPAVGEAPRGLAPSVHLQTPAEGSESHEVIDRYALLSMIGSGSMGRVYEARHRILGSRAALKLLNRTPSPGLSEDQQARLFAAQARAAAQLEHPNAVRVIDAGETAEGDLYVVMDYMEGRTLSTALKDEGALPEAQLLSLLEPVASALLEAHERRIIHNNLKPSRIILKDIPGLGTIPLLYGFGLMEEDLEEVLPKGTLYGTPRYMAPEQITGSPPSAETDLYAFGTVLYESLAGHPPFRERGVKQLVLAKVQSQPLPLPEVGPRGPISRELRAITMALLQRNRARRPSDTGALVGWLRAIQDGRPGAVPLDELMDAASV